MKKAAKKKTAKKAVKKAAKKATQTVDVSASKLIDGRIKELGGWRGKMLAEVRALIKAAVPDVAQEWKWGIPVWSYNGIITTGEVYKSVVKLTFAKGASVTDPARLFNSSLEGGTRRAIDIRENEKIDEKALKALIRAAADVNTRTPKTLARKAPKKT